MENIKQSTISLLRLHTYSLYLYLCIPRYSLSVNTIFCLLQLVIMIGNTELNLNIEHANDRYYTFDHNSRILTCQKSRHIQLNYIIDTIHQTS